MPSEETDPERNSNTPEKLRRHTSNKSLRLSDLVPGLNQMIKNGLSSSGSILIDTKQIIRGSIEDEITSDMKLSIVKDEFESVYQTPFRKITKLAPLEI